MRILHVIESLDPAGGGPPSIAARLAAAQATLGFKTEMLCYQALEARQRVETSLTPIPGFQAVVVNRIQPRGRLERALGKNLRAWLRAHLADYDVVHLHGVWDPIFPITASLARARHIPYCVMLNGMLDPWSLSQSPIKKKIALAICYRKMLARAAFLHLGNADEQKLIEPLRLPTPVEIIPNGVFPEEVAVLPARGKFYGLHPELGGRPFILFLSRLHYKKGLDYLAEAFGLVVAAMPDIHLVVAGPDGGEKAPFEQRIAALGLASRTHLIGPVYGEEKFAAMVDASVFCLPSRQEGFSMAITEALGCGLPVVISPACHFPEVEHAGAGRSVELEPKRIAEAIVSLLSDDAARLRAGAAGRAMVMARFTWPAIARSCIDAYNRHRPSSKPR